MKYIRTKDGIYKIIKDLYFGRLLLNNKEIVSLSDSDVKIADTIEELCDMFVCIRKDNSKALLSCVDEVLPLRMCYIGIYGAIWTDKGLIYVAKMNENGELELL